MIDLWKTYAKHAAFQIISKGDPKETSDKERKIERREKRRGKIRREEERREGEKHERILLYESPARKPG